MPCEAIQRIGALVAAAGCAVCAWGHDTADAPHVRCALDGSDTLICLYERHPTGATRPSRAGYADKGRYMLSCPSASDSDGRTFATRICRAGTGTMTSFQCWTAVRRDDWLVANENNTASEREVPTQVYSLSGSGLQETLLKLLADPTAVGRPHFVARDDDTVDDITAYANTCGLATAGALSSQDVVNLLPTLEVFGAPRATPP